MANRIITDKDTEWISLSSVLESGEYNCIANSKKGFMNFVESGYLQIKTMNKGTVTTTNFKTSELDELVDLLSNYISLKDVYEKYDLNYEAVNSLEKQFNIQRLKISKYSNYFRIEDAEKYFSTENYCWIDDLTSMFKTTKTVINKLRAEEKLDTIKLRGKVHFFRDQITQITKEMEKVRNNYYTLEEALSVLNATEIPESIKRYETSTLWKLALEVGSSKVKTAYSIKDIQEEKEIREKRFFVQQAYENDPLETFETLVKLEGIEFSSKSEFTKYLWFNYVKNKLSKTRSNKKTLKRMIKALVDSTKYLSDFVIKKELYSFTSNDINLYLINKDKPYSCRVHLYSFLIEFEKEVKLQTSKSKTRKTTYNVKKLINPYKDYEEQKIKKETYSYEEYDAIYNYAKDMKHKQRAIEDAENILNGVGNAVRYSSAWLFVLIHLSNALRHTDVEMIPKINLKRVGIHSLNDIKQRNLTIKESEIIVDQLREKVLNINKTGTTNRFYCADDLLIPMATALVICTLVAEKTTTIDNDYIINLGEKTRSFHYQKAHKAFFEEFNVLGDKFEFKSLKMNRTILVMIYMILLKKGRGGAALRTAQRLRAHKDFETTNLYIQLSQEDVDKLCESLFKRKHFGFITDLLATILIGNNENRDERTKEIVAINGTFGGVQKIEASTGFINKTMADRQLVADRIFNMGIDKATELLFDLNANLLPSREENIQCIVSSEGCLKRGLDCKSCQYAVPNFYAIASLIESIKTTIKDFIEDYDPESSEVEKTHLMNSLYIEMDNFERAVQKFGKEEVFRFFEGGEQEYNELLDLLDTINTAEDLDSFLTYQPLYLN